MNRLYKNLLLILLPLLAIALMVGCEEEEEIATFPQPEIMEINPGEALIGASVTINGEGLQDVVGVKFGSIDATDFEKSANSLTVTVPDGLEEGETKVTVFYDGASEKNLGPSASITFKVLYPPVLIEAVPDEVKPGFDVTISGNYLKEASALLFGDIVTPFEASQTSITTTVPLNAPAGETEITVETPGGTATLPFNVLAKTPEIHSFEPNEGKPGDEVTVTGLFFIDVESVMVGDSEVDEFTVQSSTELKFTIPVGAGTGNIKVTTALGEATSDESLDVLVGIPLPYTVYDDGVNSDWEVWGGWGTSTQEFESTEQPNSGTMSVKVVYAEDDAWGAIQLHPTAPDPFSLEGATMVKLSVYGGSGSDGNQVAVYIKAKGAGDPPDDQQIKLTLVEGEYTEFEVLLSEMGDPANINELVIKNWGNAGMEVYVDDIIIE